MPEKKSQGQLRCGTCLLLLCVSCLLCGCRTSDETGSIKKQCAVHREQMFLGSPQVSTGRAAETQWVQSKASEELRVRKSGMN